MFTDTVCLIGSRRDDLEQLPIHGSENSKKNDSVFFFLKLYDICSIFLPLRVHTQLTYNCVLSVDTTQNEMMKFFFFFLFHFEFLFHFALA